VELLLEIGEVRVGDALVQLALRRHLVGEQLAHVRAELIGRDRRVHRDQALLDRVAELGGGLVAVVGLGPQRGGDQIVVRLEAGVDLRRQRVLAARDLLGERAIIGLGPGLVEPRPGQQLEQHDARGVEVGAMIDHTAADQLLRGHVTELAKSNLGICGSTAHHALGDAEVDHLGLTLERHQHVRR
jgi:hypothetical protein